MMKMAVGPINYFWEKSKLIDFYAQLIRTPVDIVYLGETVCSKRREMSENDWFQLAEDFQQAGKQVVLSGLGLLESESELSTAKRLCSSERFLIEANDMAAVFWLHKNQHPFVAGSGMNIYHFSTLDYLISCGLNRWVMPVELGKDQLRKILAPLKGQALESQVETEVFAYGRLPLAHSARCFTARAHGLKKDQCRFCCRQYPDGLLLETREHQPLFMLNGVQTQSALIYDLSSELNNLQAMGVDVVRLSPCGDNFFEVVEYYHHCLSEAIPKFKQLPDTCNGYWFGAEGNQQIDNHPKLLNVCD